MASAAQSNEQSFPARAQIEASRALQPPFVSTHCFTPLMMFLTVYRKHFAMADCDGGVNWCSRQGSMCTVISFLQLVQALHEWRTLGDKSSDSTSPSSGQLKNSELFAIAHMNACGNSRCVGRPHCFEERAPHPVLIYRPDTLYIAPCSLPYSRSIVLLIGLQIPCGIEPVMSLMRHRARHVAYAAGRHKAVLTISLVLPRTSQQPPPIRRLHLHDLSRPSHSRLFSLISCARSLLHMS
jgi:hypothetical protein